MDRRTWGLAVAILGTTALAVGAMFALAERYQLALNVTPSLPGHVYLIDRKDKTPVKDGLIAFRVQNAAPLPDNITVVKIVKGLPGDEITVIDRSVYVNGRFLAWAKPQAMSGEPLVAIPSQTIGKDSFYVYAPHPDSFDSRYAKLGLIDSRQIVGTARELF